jgi:hypothetical protein
MLDKKIFVTKIIQIAELKGLTLLENYAKSMYDLIKNDFTDEEFVQICDYILKNEELYNKMPEPRHFYKHKKCEEEQKPYKITPELEASIQWEYALQNKKEINDLAKQILESMGDDYGGWRWRMSSEHPNPTGQQWLRKEFLERYAASKTGEKILYIEREKARNTMLAGGSLINKDNNSVEYANKPVSLGENIIGFLKQK